MSAASTTPEEWERVASGELGLHEISPEAFAWYSLGYANAIDAMTAQVLQARHDADRLYVQAMNDDERVRAVDGRLTRALASMPPGAEPHSPAYFSHLLRGVIGGA